MPSVIQRSFAWGEVAPSLYARADIAQYALALRTCRNFVVHRHGGASNRSGFRFVAAAKRSTPARLFKFILNSDESYVIEAGDRYFRFYLAGEQLTLSGHAFEVSTPYPYGDLPLLQAKQSGGVMTFSHPGYAPRELTRDGHTSWTLATVAVGPTIAAPANPMAVAGGAGTRTIRYVVTTIEQDTLQQSIASDVVALGSAADPTVAAPHVLSWDAVDNAEQYLVYQDPVGNGIFGFLGTASGEQYSDTGNQPDLSLTPPKQRALFDSSGGYPGVVGYFQQRRLFANTTDNPELAWASRVGLPSNFTRSVPLQDSDAISFRLSADQRQEIRHLVGLKKLVILTEAGEWLINGDGADGVLKPNAINADEQAWNGAATVPPVVIGNTIVYVQKRGSLVRDLTFDNRVDSFSGKDLTLFAAHLVDGFTVLEIDYAQTPHSIVWAVRSDGTLLGLTYIREEGVFGWHRHDSTNGAVESIAVVGEGAEDVLYALMRRTINGRTVRYVERLESRMISDFAQDAFFVDCGITYADDPTMTITGLHHLEGELVAVLADGNVVFNGDPEDEHAEAFRVTDGQIELARAASVVHVGLPITADLELLDLDAPGTTVRDQRKHLRAVSLVVDQTRGLLAGRDADHLFEFKPSPFVDYGGDIPVTSGRIEVTVDGAWEDVGRVLIRQTDPLPVTVLAAMPNYDIGG